MDSKVLACTADSLKVPEAPSWGNQRMQVSQRDIEDPPASWRKVRMNPLRSLLGVAVLCCSLVPRPVMAGDADGVIMQNGKMMMMKSGKAMGSMQGDMTMSNGAKMMADGTIIMKDGAKTRMKDGQMMMMDGKIMEGGKANAMGNQQP
jgi:hypothetical protein